MIKTYMERSPVLLLVLAFVLNAGGCASWVGMEPEPGDPLEPYNRSMFALNQHLETYIAKPVARGYKKVVPAPIDRGITNFFSNLDEPTNIFNNLLQLKIKAAASDLGRMAINTTLGFFGFMDVASSWGLEKHDEDFGQTLGYWGVPTGPYLVLPIIGPNDFRDTGGFAMDWVTHFINRRVGDNRYGWSMWLLRYVDATADALRNEKVLSSAAVDPYIFYRESYLQRRRYLVYDGNPPLEEEEDFE
jgi:phospholipid-binding lipoprotein MlaA